MRLGRILILGVTFIAGGFSQWAYTKFVVESPERKTAQLWKQLAQFNAHLEDPQNREWDLGVNAWRVTPPFDLDPVLAQLVSAGELDHFDVVLPTVPSGSRSWRHLSRFAQAHPEIIDYGSSPQYSVVSPRGQQPFHVDLWLKPGSETTVKSLVEELEAMAAKDPPAGA